MQGGLVAEIALALTVVCTLKLIGVARWSFTKSAARAIEELEAYKVEEHC
jgi:hypothetical protein